MFAKIVDLFKPNKVTLSSKPQVREHMSGPNKHITEFLSYYCKLDQPEYAVLLNGVWGIGKSHFIDNFIKQQSEDELKFYRISLFGMKTLQDLNSEIFSQLHPNIGSKKAQLVYRTLISALPSVSINTDLDGDEKHETSGKFNISKVAEVFGVGEQKGNKSAVFVFDDLERTSIHTKEILGFLNRYVETFKQKVIVIANEEEIEKEDQTKCHDESDELQKKEGGPVGMQQKADKNSYQIQKEKLIGKTFLLEPETRLAIPQIVNSLEGDSPDVVKNVYRRNMPNIISVFEESGYKNLRHIKYGLRDFIRLYEVMDGEFRQEEEIVDRLLSVHLTLMIEKNAGNLLGSDIAALDANNFMWQNTIIDELNKRYTDFGSRRMLLNGKVWKDVVFHSKLDKKEINKDLSRLTAKENIPAWQKLWNYWELSNDEFNLALQETVDSINNHKISNACELIHVIGLLHRFSLEGLYPKKRFEILKEAKRNIEVNKAEIMRHFDSEEFWGRPSCSGYQVVDGEKMVIRYFVAFLSKIHKEYNLQKASTEINDIFIQIESRYDDWKQALRSGPWGAAKFHDLAVLNAIDEGVFVDKLCYNIEPSQRRAVLHTVATRIDKNKLPDEIVWICNVVTRVDAELKRDELTGIEAYQLRKWAETLKKSCDTD
ncbi:P-loop NTPase fold protein [Thiomicrorhabdus hydrogeniphila]